MHLLKKVGWIVLMNAIIFGHFIYSSYAQNENTGDLVVKIMDLKNNQGNVLIALYNSQEDYEQSGEDELQNCIYRSDIITISEDQAATTFHNLPFGNYVLIAIHDHNSNQQLDRNFIGMPVEGFGFSNNPGLIVDKPDWEDIQFNLQSSHQTITIRMKYL